MGERKGTNKYYPPDFDPKIHYSLNGYHGVHALRERGKKASQGILVIRFEMPYNCWCLTCNNPIGMGVRYNAEKQKVGMYHSTPIYKFTMRCHLCAGDIVIQTDPQNFDYVILEGARRKEQRWDPAENEQIFADDRDTKKKLALDPMFKLEHSASDKAKMERAIPTLDKIQESRTIYKDDFELIRVARKQLMDSKKQAKQAASVEKTTLQRMSLDGSGIRLLPESEEDGQGAALIQLSTMMNTTRDPCLKPDIDEQPIFGGGRSGDTSIRSNTAPPSDTKKSDQLRHLVHSLRRDVLVKRGTAFRTRLTAPLLGKRPASVPTQSSLPTGNKVVREQTGPTALALLAADYDSNSDEQET